MLLRLVASSGCPFGCRSAGKTFCRMRSACRANTMALALSPSLIHEPTGAVSFGGLSLGPSRDDALDLVPHGLEVAQACPQRTLQVRQRVEQAVVRRTPAQLLPQPLDRVQLRAVARQPLEL